jgi:threonine dehydrogenase-like Zn-dependent dehydrogenase
VTVTRQLTFVEAGRVEWREVADAVLPGPSSAVVRPLAVARCDLDLPIATAGLFPDPFPVGHETIAEVVTIGDQVRVRKPGDRLSCRSRCRAERVGTDASEAAQPLVLLVSK